MEELLLSSGASFPLFIEGARPFHGKVFSGINFNASFDLYTQGNYGAAESLPLYLCGEALSCSNSLPMYIFNSGVGASLNLYLKGEGENDGYIPFTSSLNLYLKCAFGATLDFYMYGGPQPSVSESLDLFTSGMSDTNASMDFSIPNVYGSLTSSFNLYTSGV
jgi:hypothetical protein